MSRVQRIFPVQIIEARAHSLEEALEFCAKRIIDQDKVFAEHGLVNITHELHAITAEELKYPMSKEEEAEGRLSVHLLTSMAFEWELDEDSLLKTIQGLPIVSHKEFMKIQNSLR